MTQALGVIFSAAAALLVGWGFLKVALDVFGFSLALAGSMVGLLLSRNLRGGLLRKPVQILALSPSLFAVVQVLDLSGYFTGSITIVVLEEFAELLFLGVLFLGFFMLYRTVESLGEAGQGKV